MNKQQRLEPHPPKHLSEPWFSLIKVGLKVCEGRLDKGVFGDYCVGDVLHFYNDDFGEVRTLTRTVTRTQRYASFRKYLIGERLYRCLPGFDTIESGVSVYRKYFSPEDEEKHGVVAVSF